jgi:hypothetical protein
MLVSKYIDEGELKGEGVERESNNFEESRILLWNV